MEYTDVNRGKIQHRERKQQIIDFSNMRFGNITPTDFDGVIEYRGKGFVILEFKLKNANLPDGQKLAIERCVDDIKNGGKEAVAFVCSHDVEDPKKDIDAAKARVVSRYYNTKWKELNGNMTAYQWTEIFLRYLDGKEVNHEGKRNLSV